MHVDHIQASSKKVAGAASRPGRDRLLKIGKLQKARKWRPVVRYKSGTAREYRVTG